MGTPLRGLRVLDLSRVLAGPWCTMLLGDAGADVIKLERTKTGDETRNWGPPFVNGDVSTYFLSVNRNKSSIAVDIKTTEGLDLCRRLATEWADVLVENFKVGTMERLGLSYETLRQENPGLVYCSITGFGSTGPLSSRPGYDVIISGMYGLMSITGEEHGDPAKVGVAITDVVAGTLAHGGILAALYQRNRTGRGQQVETSLMETQLASLVNIASSSLNSPEGTPPPQRWGTAHESIVPYQTFPCKHDDGEEKQYVVVGAGNDLQFQKLCNAMGMDEVASSDRFRTNADRVKNRNELVAVLEKRFLQKTRNEWVDLLSDKGFPIGPVRSVPEAFECEQAIHRGIVTEMNHVVAGKIKLPRTPILYVGESTTDNLDKPKPPPMLGEHTEEILTNVLDMTPGEVRALERAGVIECWRQQEPK